MMIKNFRMLRLKLKNRLYPEKFILVNRDYRENIHILTEDDAKICKISVQYDGYTAVVSAAKN